MRNLHWTIGILILVAVSFQNCGREFLADSRVSGATTQPTPDSKVMASPKGAIVKKSYEDFIRPGDTTYKIRDLALDTEAGTVTVTLLDGSKVIKALPTDVMGSVQSVFEGASLCRPIALPNQICTMEYVYPYAEVTDPATAQTVKLGETRNGCTGYYDFCDSSKSTALKAVITEVTNQILTYSTLSNQASTH